MDTAEIASRRRICHDIGLPIGDSYTQDWAYELPEEFRSADFFRRYAGAYSTPGYAAPEKRLLMQLMLDIANDLLQSDHAAAKEAWDCLTDILQIDHHIHRDQLEYWSLPGEPLEDAFPLTPYIRAFLSEVTAKTTPSSS